MNKMSSYAKLKNTLSLREKVGQLFMPAAFINDTEPEIQLVEQLVKEHGVGGICFFHSRASAATNFEGKKEIIYNEHSLDTLRTLINRYQKAAKHPLIVSIDAEWGLAMRMENTPQYPYAITLGAMQNQTDLLYEVGKNIAHDCKVAGIHWNLAPVTDINSNPNNPVIGYRSFGGDKEKVLQNAQAFMDGAKSEGVLSCIKHFPGHGDTTTDSHLGLPVIHTSKEELWKNEIYPFQKLIEKGVDAVMVGHLAVPSLSNGKSIPATISKEIITGVLRNELKYTGVIISDALNMHSVSKQFTTKGELEWLAFNAGTDVLCFAEHVKEGIDMIVKNASKEQIETSFGRVWKLKETALENAISEIDVPPKNPNPLNEKLALESLTLVQGEESAIASFRGLDYATVTVARNTELSSIDDIRLQIQKMQSAVDLQTHILLKVVPPNIKPKDNFGFLDTEIALINELLKTKKVALYLYGNPYALDLFEIPKTTIVVVVYQNMPVFEKTAHAHFMGEIKAKGKLPIQLKSAL